jgi:hypothetical protein
LRFAIRVLAGIFAALFLLVAVAGVLMWPRNLRNFINAQQQYWRDLYAWVSEPLRLR